MRAVLHTAACRGVKAGTTGCFATKIDNLSETERAVLSRVLLTSGGGGKSKAVSRSWKLLLWLEKTRNRQMAEESCVRFVGQVSYRFVFGLDVLRREGNGAVISALVLVRCIRPYTTSIPPDGCLTYRGG